MSHPLRLLYKKSKFITAIGIIVAILAAGVSLLFPLEYRADAEVLIIPRTSVYADPYTVARSAERVADTLSRVIYSNDFFDHVMVQGDYMFDRSAFESLTERQKRRVWKKTIVSSVAFGTGMLEVGAYSEDQQQAEQLIGAVLVTLMDKAKDYTGTELSMKIVNQPLATRWPVRPNIPLNAGLGFLIGVTLTGLYILKQN